MFACVCVSVCLFVWCVCVCNRQPKSVAMTVFIWKFFSNEIIPESFVSKVRYFNSFANQTAAVVILVAGYGLLKLCAIARAKRVVFFPKKKNEKMKQYIICVYASTEFGHSACVCVSVIQINDNFFFNVMARSSSSSWILFVQNQLQT